MCNSRSQCIIQEVSIVYSIHSKQYLLNTFMNSGSHLMQPGKQTFNNCLFLFSNFHCVAKSKNSIQIVNLSKYCVSGNLWLCNVPYRYVCLVEFDGDTRLLNRMVYSLDDRHYVVRYMNKKLGQLNGGFERRFQKVHFLGIEHIWKRFENTFENSGVCVFISISSL